MDIERLTMKLVVESGNAKSKAMESIARAKAGNIAEARQLVQEANNMLSSAHEIQTDLLQEESDGNLGSPSMLLMHAQDHLMGSLMLIDLASEFIDLYEKIDAPVLAGKGV